MKHLRFDNCHFILIDFEFRSKDGIEAIKHRTRPIYGVQFQPEKFIEPTCGRDIFNNFLKLEKEAIDN
jgi:anthranilate/para-aminobenzoate synthase component II